MMTAATEAPEPPAEIGPLGIFIIIVIQIVFWGSLIFFLVKHTQIERRRKKIYSVIAASNKRSIDEISSICQSDYSRIEKDLQKMIDNVNEYGTRHSKFEMLKNAHIDVVRKKIVLAIDNENYETVESTKPLIQKAVDFLAGNDDVKIKAKAKTVIVCGGCGANNTVVEGVVKNCEYCGVPLK